MGLELQNELVQLQELNALIVTSPEKYSQLSTDVLKVMCNQKNFMGVFVTINKPVDVLKQILQQNGVSTENLYFIDVISRKIGVKIVPVKNTIYLESPKGLTDISIGISQALSAIKSQNKFVYFDSISTLLLYNEPTTVSRFAHFVTGRVHQWKAVGILVALEKEMDEKLLSQISQFCDKTFYYQ
ncbi:MAG TPA: hypothetical protein VI894_00440 [Candidatus Nanoarchaeia archaeon]|nr:hypothetical protein [Candidatus Nanoarchaeia archaeon]